MRLAIASFVALLASVAFAQAPGNTGATPPSGAPPPGATGGAGAAGGGAGAAPPPPGATGGAGAPPPPGATGGAGAPPPPGATGGAGAGGGGGGGIAQSGPGASPTAGGGATPTGSGGGTTHTVAVGGAGNTFEPKNTTVKVGDVVMFQFMTSTHNVLQSDAPGGCTKSTNPAAKQFPAQGLATQGQTWSYTVAPLTPTAKGVWFYCAPHCQGGMTANLVLAGGANGAAPGASPGASPPGSSPIGGTPGTGSGSGGASASGNAGGANSGAGLSTAPLAIALVVVSGAIYLT